MIFRPALLSTFARHRKVQALLYIGNAVHCEECASTSRIPSSSRYLSQNGKVRQQRSTPNDINTDSNKETSDINSMSGDQLSATNDPSLERSMQLLDNDLLQREHLRRREEKAARRRGRPLRAANSTDLASWRQHMNQTLERQGGNGQENARAERFKGKDTKQKLERARVMALTMESSRMNQLDVSPPDNGQRILSPRPIIPGGGGGNNNFPVLQFERTNLRYPPSDVYPPPLPVVREVDLLTAARALGVLRNCELEWYAEKGIWRKTSRSNEYYEQHELLDYLDSEQGLEYIGDSIMHTISKSLIMTTFPGKSVALYNVAAAWLVSNDSFSYMFEDSGLEEERVIVANQLMSINKKRQLEKFLPDTLSPQERLACEEAAVPDPVLPLVSHRRKADLLEAYVGAVFEIYGFQMASKWCTMLLEPWLDLIDRTAEFHSDKFLSPSGEAKKRALIRQQKREEDEKRRTGSWWGKMRSRFFAIVS